MGALLVGMLALPLAGVAVLYLLPGTAAERAATRLGAAAGGLVLVLAAALALGFDYGRSRPAGRRRPPLGPRARRCASTSSVDGISLPLIVLTALLSALCFLYSLRHMPAGGSKRSYIALLLILEIGMLGTFMAADLLLFFLFFEIVLLPMWGLIAVWGGEDRRRAATKFILYTLLGSAVMLVGFLVVFAGSKPQTFDIAGAHAPPPRTGQLSHAAALTAFALIGLGFAVKTPMFPLHTWLPDAHTEAPTAGSVLLAGVLLKMGTYGFIRIAVPILPQAARTYAPAIAAFGVVGVVYGVAGLPGDRPAPRRRPQAPHRLQLDRPHGLRPAGHRQPHPRRHERRAVRLGRPRPDHRPAVLPGRRAQGAAALGAPGPARARAVPDGAQVRGAARLRGDGLAGPAGPGRVLGRDARAVLRDQARAGLSQGSYIAMAAVAGLGLVLTAAYLLAVVRRVCMGPAAEPGEPGSPACPAGPARPPWPS